MISDDCMVLLQQIPAFQPPQRLSRQGTYFFNGIMKKDLRHFNRD